MIKEIFTGNILTKLMALVMAVALWLYAINRQTENLTETVKLVVSVPEGITVLEQSAEEVTIYVRGPQNVMDGVANMIKDRRIKAQYTIKESPEGIEDQIKQTIPLSREHLNLPNAVKLVRIYPNKVDVTLGKLQQKRLKVVVQKKGEPAVGYIVSNEFVFPGEVSVVGPLNMLKETSFINTVPIDIGGITVDQNRTFPWKIGIDPRIIVKKGDKTIPVAVECKENVQVWLQIAEQQDTRLYEKVKIKVMRPPDYSYEIKLQDEFANVKVKGPKLALDKLNVEEVVLYIDVTALKPPGPYKQPIKCNLPKNVELVDKLSEVHVDIREKTRSLEVK